MIIKFTAKCSDCFNMTVYDANGHSVLETDGRVPDFLGDWGDNVRLMIDTETGMVKNWDIKKKQFEEWLEEEKQKDTDSDE
jgi:hypothetical protein